MKGRALRCFSLAMLAVLSGGNMAAASYHPPIDLDRIDGREYLFLCEAGFEAPMITEPFSETVWRLRECERFIASTRLKLAAGPVHGYEVCMPGSVTNYDLVYIGSMWLDENPEYLHKTADEVLAAATNGEWPCRSDVDETLHNERSR